MAEMAEEDGRDWNALPIDVLRMVSDHLDLVDLVRFGLMSRWWAEASKERRGHTSSPWLLLPEDPSTEMWGMLSPTSQRFVLLHIPSAEGRRCFGVCKGWVFLARNEVGCHIVNPFTGVQILLPDCNVSDPDGGRRLMEVPFSIRFKKAIISAHPTPANLAAGNCFIFAIDYFSRLLWCRMEDNPLWDLHGGEWQMLATSPNGEDAAYFSSANVEDILFHNGALFYVLLNACVGLFSITVPPIRLNVIGSNFINQLHPSDFAVLHGFTGYSPYLVSSGDKLFGLIRYRNRENFEWVRSTKLIWQFLLYPSFDEGVMHWLKNYGLEDVANGFYIGTSMSSAYHTGPKVFYTDETFRDAVGEPSDLGVFSLEDLSNRQFNLGGRLYTSRSPPVWFLFN